MAQTQNGTIREMDPLTMLEFCRAFERQYKLESSQFYERYLDGEFVGIHDAYRWAGYWEAYLELRGTPAEPVEKDLSKELFTAIE